MPARTLGLERGGLGGPTSMGEGNECKFTSLLQPFYSCNFFFEGLEFGPYFFFFEEA